MTKCKLTKDCPGVLDVTVCFAVHDDNSLDILVRCPRCTRTLNHFLSLDEMVEVEEGD